jgi:beta-glucosidase
MGYRWYDSRHIEPLFPFGHGLSYTSFTYSDLAVEKAAAPDGPALTVSLKVKNMGRRAGSDVVQLYVREQRPRLQRPEKELKAFAKVALEPGEEREVQFALGARDFAVYHPRARAWTISSETFDLLVGASSRDIRLQASVVLEGISVPLVSLDRFSPLRDWLAHPAFRARLWPVLSPLRQQLLGGNTTPFEEGQEQHDLLQSFLDGMPIAKLVVFGLLSEQELAELIALAKAPESQL